MELSTFIREPLLSVPGTAEDTRAQLVCEGEKLGANIVPKAVAQKANTWTVYSDFYGSDVGSTSTAELKRRYRAVMR
ncbi:unnamed protein product [Ectocarpus sp. 6 AP-2014]